MVKKTTFAADLDRVSRQRVTEALQTMFHATAIPGAKHRCARENWAVAIEFRGAPSGVFTMRLDREDARALAAAFLGREPEPGCVGEDGLLACELANILCGSVLSGAGGMFELGPPELVAAETEGAGFRAGFLLDTGGALEIAFRVADEEVLESARRQAPL